MSLNETHLSIVFSDKTARLEVQEWFELFSESAQNFNKKMAALGIKTKFKDENPFLERMTAVESFLELDFTHGSDFRFPSALAKKLPNAILVVQTVVDDYNLGGKKTYIYQGESIKKDRLIEILDGLDSRVAMILASQLGVRLATKYFKALTNPNEEFSGALMFWYLIHYLDQYPAVRKVLGKCDIKCLTSFGENALHYAAKTYGRCGDDDIEWLISQGCDINVVNKDGDTPLLIASRLGDRRNGAMLKLLHHGVDPNIRDAKGLTAVHYYCATGYWLDMISGLKQCNADFNADSPMGSPLWIANAVKRDAARGKIWARNLTLSYPQDAYGEDTYKNLITAAKHHDLESMAKYFCHAQLSDLQAQVLYCYACYYQCGAMFDHLQQAVSWRLVANTRDTQFDKDYALNHLDLLYDDHPAVGDSYHIFVSVITQSTNEQVNELALTRDFGVNCLRLVKWRSSQALDFFRLLKTKGLQLEELFLGKQLWLGWDQGDMPENILEVLIPLREMGLIFHDSTHQMKRSGLADDLIERFCHP
jgi:hypothetical protein